MPWDQNEGSPIDVIADGGLVGFILAMACRIYPRLVSDPCTSPQLSKVSSRFSERVPLVYKPWWSGSLKGGNALALKAAHPWKLWELTSLELGGIIWSEP